MFNYALQEFEKATHKLLSNQLELD